MRSIFILALLAVAALPTSTAAAQTVAARTVAARTIAAAAERPAPETICVEARIYLVVYRPPTGRPLTGPDSAPVWRSCTDIAAPRAPVRRPLRRVNGH